MTEHPDDRFWKHVQKGQGCWEWTGALNDHGYGIATPHPHHPGAKRGAHRIAWAMSNGTIPDGMGVCHHCDNPRCVRPEHLFLGTNADNLGDAARKDRMSRKLSRENVAEIRALSERGIPHVTIAGMYDVATSTVSRVARGISRRYCDEVTAAPLPPAPPEPAEAPPRRPAVPRLYNGY